MPEPEPQEVRLHVSSMSSDERDFLMVRPETWDNKIIDAHRLAQNLSLSPQWQLGDAKKPLNSSLGSLDAIPREMVEAILEQTNLETLMMVRCTNSKLRTIVGEWPPFHELMVKGRNTVRALLATGAASLWTAVQVQQVLFTTRCELCHEHGEFLQLLKLMRCCFRCLSTDRRLLAVSDKSVAQLGVSSEDRDRIPHLLTLARPNGHWGYREHIPRYMAFDFQAVLNYASHTKTPSSERPSSDRPVPSLLRKRQVDRPSYHTLSKIPSQHLAAPDSSPFRFLTTVRQPPCTTQTLEPVYCRGCRHFWNYLGPMHYFTHTLYTQDEICKHVESCPYAYLFYRILYPNGDAASADPIHTILLLDPNRRSKFLFPRHKELGYRENQYYFEVIPADVLNHLGDQEDDIGVSFFGPANGQASWATAERVESTWDLFGHYSALMMDRKKKIEERLREPLVPWGLERI